MSDSLEYWVGRAEGAEAEVVRLQEECAIMHTRTSEAVAERNGALNEVSVLRAEDVRLRGIIADLQVEIGRLGAGEVERLQEDKQILQDEGRVLNNEIDRLREALRSVRNVGDRAAVMVAERALGLGPDDE